MISNGLNNNPNSFLKVSYNEIVRVRGVCLFDGEKAANGERGTIGLYEWYDTTFLKHKIIPIPSNTKKALIKVIVPEGVVAPKYPAFYGFLNGTGLDYDYEPPFPPSLPTGNYVLNIGIARRPLMDGEEIEVWGIDEIRKLTFSNNIIDTPASPKIFNIAPVVFLLGITLYK